MLEGGLVWRGEAGTRREPEIEAALLDQLHGLGRVVRLRFAVGIGEGPDRPAGPGLEIVRAHVQVHEIHARVGRPVAGHTVIAEDRDSGERVGPEPPGVVARHEKGLFRESRDGRVHAAYTAR